MPCAAPVPLVALVVDTLVEQELVGNSQGEAFGASVGEAATVAVADAAAVAKAVGDATGVDVSPFDAIGDAVPDGDAFAEAVGVVAAVGDAVEEVLCVAVPSPDFIGDAVLDAFSFAVAVAPDFDKCDGPAVALEDVMTVAVWRGGDAEVDAVWPDVTGVDDAAGLVPDVTAATVVADGSGWVDLGDAAGLGDDVAFDGGVADEPEDVGEGPASWLFVVDVSFDGDGAGSLALMDDDA